MIFKDRLALVTGAGSGLGRAIAEALAARGAVVGAIDVDEAAARETAKLITKGGRRASAYRADMSKSAEVDAAVSAAVRDHGALEIMVNNAGVLDGYFSVDEMDESLWRRVIDIDLTSVFLGSKRALSEMLPRGRGRIVNMASVAGLNGSGGGAAYIVLALIATQLVSGNDRRMMASESIREHAAYLRAVARFTDPSADLSEVYGAAIRQQAALADQLQAARALLLERPHATAERQLPPPLPRAAISESMARWTAVICST